MGRSRFSKLTVAVLAAGVLLLAELPSRAHVTSDPSVITLNHGNGRFSGEVKSPPPRCRRNRTVVVRKGRPQKSDILVGTATTGKNGGWSVPDQDMSGDFYAVVKSDVGGGYGHSHKCRRNISRHIKVRN